MAEMIATYSAPGTSPAASRAGSGGAVRAARDSERRPRPLRMPAGNGSGYLNEVSSLTVRRRARADPSGHEGCDRMSAYRFCRTDDIGASRRRAESLLVSVLSRRAADDAGRVQAVDPRPSGLVQQLHGRLLGLRPDRRPDRRQAAFRYPRPQDRRPSRSSATGSWPSPARLARLEARDSRPPANRSPKSPRLSPLPASCSAQADMSRKRS